MSMRDEFEKVFPVPEGVEWIDERQEYRITSDDDHWFDKDGWADFCNYLGRWKGWQSARAQGGQGAEVVAWSWEYRGLHVSTDKAFIEKIAADGFAVRPLVFADTQPALQGIVPEDVIRQCEDAIQYASEIRGGCISGVREAQKRVRAILSTFQPEADGRIDHQCELCGHKWSSNDLMDDCMVCTKRPQPPKEGE